MWKVVYIFLSSTFKDMHYERDYIRNYVIPSLNDKLKEHRIIVRLIDLRWGINTSNEQEALREYKILKVCLDEIDRTRPYFIALLGDRNGWVPDAGKWNMVINRLSNSERTYFEKLSPQSVTSLEIHYGALMSREALDHSFFFIRTPHSYTSLEESEQKLYRDAYSDMPPLEKKRAIRQLSSLKSKIHKAYREQTDRTHVFDYTFDISSKNLSQLDSFGQMVERVIFEDIIDNHVTIEQSDKLTDKEQIALDDFVAFNIEHFTGRDDIISQITHCFSQSPGVTLLVGESGYGKSSLFCKILSDCRQRYDSKRYVLLEHSAGVSSNSNNSLQMLERWTEIVISHLSIAPTADTVEERFNEVCGLANQAGIKLLVLLDSVDRLDNTFTGRYLNWIEPYMHVFLTSLPENAKTIIATHQDVKVLELPPFTRTEAIELLNRMAATNGKELYQQMIVRILAKSGGRLDNKVDMIHLLFSNQRDERTHAYQSPLWLLLISNILFNLDSDDFHQIEHRSEPTEELRIEGFFNDLIQETASNPGEVFLQMMERIRDDFGGEFADDVLYLIVVSKNGLNDKHVADILGERFDELTYAQLKRYLRGFLVEQGEQQLVMLTHTILRDSVLGRLDGAQRRYYHTLILNYVRNRENPLNDTMTFHALHAMDIEATQSAFRNISVNTEQVSKDICEFLVQDMPVSVDFIYKVLTTYTNTTESGYIFTDPYFLKRTLDKIIANVPDKLKSYCLPDEHNMFMEMINRVFQQVIAENKEMYISYMLDEYGNKVLIDSQTLIEGYIKDVERQFYLYEELIRQNRLTDAELLGEQLHDKLLAEYELSSDRSYIVGLYCRLCMLLADNANNFPEREIEIYKKVIDMGSRVTDSSDCNYNVILNFVTRSYANLSLAYQNTDIDMAVSYAQQAVICSRKLGASPFSLQFHKGLVHMYILTGKYELADQAVAESISLVEASFAHNPELLEYLALLGEVLILKIEVQEHLCSSNDECEQTFEQLVHIVKRLGLYPKEYIQEIGFIVNKMSKKYIHWVESITDSEKKLRFCNNMLVVSGLYVAMNAAFRSVGFMVEEILIQMESLDDGCDILGLKNSADNLCELVRQTCDEREVFLWRFFDTTHDDKKIALLMQLHQTQFMCGYLAYIEDPESGYKLMMRSFHSIEKFRWQQTKDNRLLANGGGNLYLLLEVLNDKKYGIETSDIPFLRKMAHQILSNTSRILKDEYLTERYHTLCLNYPQDES